MIRKWAGARIALVGNPSDMFGGKTVGFLIGDFGAEVTVEESETIEIVHHPVLDPLSFRSLEHLAEIAEEDGYYGGIRLLFATCKRLYDFCRERGLPLPERHFTLRYDTTIPRQVGLGGSSAIITAALRALGEFYELPVELIPRAERPNLVLSVEAEELGLAAGLQDRVIQVYGGLMYMDFAPEYVAAHGHGRYERLALELLPPLYLAYYLRGQESGRLHSPIRGRFQQGDPEVVAAVATWAGLAEASREALAARDYGRLGELMRENFALRRRIYGDAALGARNLAMVETAARLGLPAKFAGSGGAVVMLCEDEEQAARAGETFREQGFHFTRVHPVEYPEAGE